MRRRLASKIGNSAQFASRVVAQDTYGGFFHTPNDLKF